MKQIETFLKKFPDLTESQLVSDEMMEHAEGGGCSLAGCEATGKRICDEGCVFECKDGCKENCKDGCQATSKIPVTIEPEKPIDPDVSVPS